MSIVRTSGSPKGHFLLGHVPSFRNDATGLLTMCAREYGDIVPLRFGPKRMVFLSHPDLIDYVLISNNRNFVKSMQFRAAASVLGNGLVFSEGEFWLRQRRLIQPAFHRQRIASYGDTMADFTERNITHWNDGDIVDVHHELIRLAMEIVSKTLFGADLRGVSADLGVILTHTLECLSARINSLWLLFPDTIPTPTNIRLRRAIRQLDGIVYPIINDRRASGEDGEDLLATLLQAQDDDGSRMTDQQVRDEIMTLFVAGHETTAATLTWTFYLLSQHPGIAARLKDETDRALKGRLPGAADIPHLPYAGAIITETLRLYPPVAALGREALTDCEIQDFPISRGTSLLLSMWTLHRDPRYFAEPDEFRPERWEDGLADRLPRFAYFPFGGGPRQCIGAGFAMMEAVLILSTIIQRFELELLPGQDLTPWIAPTVRPRNGLKMLVHRR